VRIGPESSPEYGHQAIAQSPAADGTRLDLGWLLTVLPTRPEVGYPANSHPVERLIEDFIEAVAAWKGKS